MNPRSLFQQSLPAILLILVTGFIVYSNTFQVPFIFDDQHSIVHNITIEKPSNVFYAHKLGLQFVQNRVVAYLTFALNYHFGGLNVTGFHAVNLLIHLVTALLVYTLLRLTFRTPYFQRDTQGSDLGLKNSEVAPQPSTFNLQPSAFIPLFAALLFVVHPVQMQAVTYIVQRMASLTAMFYLLSVVLYIQARLSIDGIRNCRQTIVTTIDGRRLTEKSGVKSKESGVRSQNSKFCQSSVVLYADKIQNLEEITNPPYLGGRIKPGLLIAGSVLAAVLAMKTKETAFTLPLAIVLYEISFFQGAWKRRLLYLLPLLATLPIIPLTIFGILDVGVDEQLASEWQPVLEEQLRVQTSMSRPDYLFTQFRVIVTYLRLLLLPVNQNLDYDYPVYTTFFTPPVFLSFFLLTAIFALGLYLFFISRLCQSSAGSYADTTQPESLLPSTCEQSEPQSESQSKSFFRLIAFGIFWFFLTLSVESSLVPIKDVIMEHRLYLPGFGAAAVFATLFWLTVEKLTRPSSGKFLFLGATLLVLALGLATFQRNHVWGDPIRLWQDVVTKSPKKARPINNLGQALEEAGRRPEAFKAFSQAIKLDPGYYKAYYNLADLYLVSDQPEKALPLLQTAINLHPYFIEAYVSIGAALMRSGRFNEMVIFLEQNLDLVGDIAEARFYLGAAYAFQGNREAAMRELAVLSQLDASYAANLAGMLGLKSNRNIPHGRK